ncbi:MAG: hypothetical protein AAF770_03620, partial [Bacteroidota bacterium]
SGQHLGSYDDPEPRASTNDIAIGSNTQKVNDRSNAVLTDSANERAGESELLSLVTNPNGPYRSTNSPPSPNQSFDCDSIPSMTIEEQKKLLEDALNLVEFRQDNSRSFLDITSSDWRYFEKIVNQISVEILNLPENKGLGYVGNLLLQAVYEQNTLLLEILLKKDGVEVWTEAFDQAVNPTSDSSVNLRIVNLILQKVSSTILNQPLPSSELSALQTAIKRGEVDLVKLLLEQETIQVNESDFFKAIDVVWQYHKEYNHTLQNHATYEAPVYDILEMVTSKLDGETLKQVNVGYVALSKAITDSSLPIVKVLLKFLPVRKQDIILIAENHEFTLALRILQQSSRVAGLYSLRSSQRRDVDAIRASLLIIDHIIAQASPSVLNEPNFMDQKSLIHYAVASNKLHDSTKKSLIEESCTREDFIIQKTAFIEIFNITEDGKHVVTWKELTCMIPRLAIADQKEIVNHEEFDGKKGLFLVAMHQLYDALDDTNKKWEIDDLVTFIIGIIPQLSEEQLNNKTAVYNKSVLEVAIKFRKEELVDELLKRRELKVDEGSLKEAVLCLATDSTFFPDFDQRLTILQVLVQKVDVRLLNKPDLIDDKSALQVAVESSKKQLVDELLKRRELKVDEGSLKEAVLCTIKEANSDNFFNHFKEALAILQVLVQKVDVSLLNKPDLIDDKSALQVAVESHKKELVDELLKRRELKVDEGSLKEAVLYTIQKAKSNDYLNDFEQAFAILQGLVQKVDVSLLNKPDLIGHKSALQVAQESENKQFIDLLLQQNGA